MMHRHITIILFTILMLQGCSTIKGLFGKKSIGDPNDPDFLNRVQELKSAYRGGNIRALDELIEVYQDPDLHVKLRVAAGKTLAQTEHPRALHAISEMVATTTAVDYTLLNESISMLGMFSENPKAADALVRSMRTMEKRTNEVHVALVKSLNRVRTKEELQKEKVEADAKARKQKEIKSKRAHDKMLLETFTSIDEIEETRQQKIEAIDSTIKVVKKRIIKLQYSLDDELDENSIDKQIDGEEKKSNDSESLKKQISENKSYIKKKIDEKEEIKKTYLQYITRFRELKGLD